MIRSTEFRDFWYSELKQKIYRCSKEFGFYPNLKKAIISLNENRNEAISREKKDNFIFEIYWDVVVNYMNSNEDDVFTFKRFCLKRKYTVKTAMCNERHFSQIATFFILNRCNLSHETFEKAFCYMDDALYKNYKVSTYITEKIGFLKLFFS